jgi:hypothetical protein
MTSPPEFLLRVVTLFLMPAWSLESIRPQIALWEQEDGRDLEHEVVKWLRWLLTHGLVEVFEGLRGVDEVCTDEEAVRRYWFQLRPRSDAEFWNWFAALQEARYDRTVENGDLIFRDFETRGIAWQGRPDGARVQQHVPVPRSDDVIVVLDTTASNLVRVQPDGSLVWRSPEFRGAPSSFSGVGLPHQGRVEAAEWSSYAVVLDVESGEILSAEFTK